IFLSASLSPLGISFLALRRRRFGERPPLARSPPGASSATSIRQLEMTESRKSSHAATRDSAETARDSISMSSQIQSMKVPDAVAAIAQAAAKANGDTEKYLPGWPLFSPPKVQLDKCSKCSREFCSSINLRRHTRVHRRTLNVDK
ncbi:unnamed protein product, partial [Urochloa humidicola]